MAIRTDFTAGEVLAAADLNDTFAAKANLSALKIRQVVAATHATSVTNNTDSATDTGLTATITPTSASNSILVMVDQAGCMKLAGNVNSSVALYLFRGATLISTQFGGYTNSSLIVNFGSMSIAYLDSPATTSATTYKTRFSNAGNFAGVTVQDASSRSSIVLLEVAP
jgi:hypothetical protein